MIVIEGVGPVGLACALFLQRLGVAADRIALPLATTMLAPTLANRTLALGLGSWHLLSRIIQLPAAAAIEQVEVSLAGRMGKTRIRAHDLKQTALGFVLDYQSLQQALDDATQAAGLVAVPSTQPAAAPLPSVCLRINAQGDPGDAVSQREFNQQAILARIHCPLLPRHVAFERFTDEGPLALLPLPMPNTYALVWCGAPAHTARRMRLNDSQFSAELIDCVGPQLHGATLLSARSSAPLSRRSRTQIVAPGQVWIGNAAQSLHPVAGQGLNLGLRDAFELARIIAPLFTPSATPQSEPIQLALQRFAKARAADRQRTISITDTLASVFAQPMLQPFESMALAALDLSAGPRQLLALRLMFGNR
jgi:2-octaprenyl-6-methoxyphenol hydroxylase